MKKIRKIIERVIVTNFRLFDSNPRDFEFNGGFAQVIANNGNGKTSLWWALKIGLTGEIPRNIGRLGEKGIIHYPNKENEHESKEIQRETNAEIVIILNNRKENGIRPFMLLDKETDQINIHTVIPPSGGIKYFVNGKKWDRKELRNVLNDLFINPDDLFLFLEQNKTANLLSGGPLGLMDAMEETFDIKEVRDNLDNAQTSYKKSKESHKESKLKMHELENIIKSLKEEYDKFKRCQDISNEIQQCKEEIVSREYLDVSIKVKDAIVLKETQSSEITSLTNKNRILIEEFNKIERTLDDLNKKKTEKTGVVIKLNQELRRMDKEKGRIEKTINDIKIKLKEIEEVKEIDKPQLLSNYESIEKQYLELNSEIITKRNEFKTFEKQLKILEKGKSIGPKSLNNFTQLLKNNSIKADSLINTIELEEGYLIKSNKLEIIQIFESILGDFRWAVLIYGNQEDFNKSIILAKESYFPNLLIHIENIEEINYNFFEFNDFKFKIKHLKIKEFISFLFQKFHKSEVKFDEGLILEKFGVRFFKIDPNSLNIDKENRINTLKRELKLFKIETEKMKKEFKEYERVKNKLKKEIDGLDIIEEEPSLIKNKQDTLIEQNNIDKDLNKIQSEVRDSEEKISEIEVEIRSNERRIGEVESNIANNKKSLEKVISKYEDLLKDIEKYEEDKKFYEKIHAEILAKYPNPRDLKYLTQYLIELKKELEGLGEIDEKAVEDYRHKSRAFNSLKEVLIKANEDLNRKIEDVERYQTEFKKYIDIVLKEIQKNFSRILRIINYDGQISRSLYRLKGRNKTLTLIHEPDKYILDDETFYGIDIKIKKPSDKRFNNFFDERGKVSSRHSGGQKALVMLGFLLAIQKTMGLSTSFYILDEPTPQLDDINNSFILKLFSELDTQIILLTPKPMLPEFFDEILVILNNKIKKIPKDLLDNVKSLENIEAGSTLFIRRNGDSN